MTAPTKTRLAAALREIAAKASPADEELGYSR